MVVVTPTAIDDMHDGGGDTHGHRQHVRQWQQHAWLQLTPTAVAVTGMATDNTYDGSNTHGSSSNMHTCMVHSSDIHGHR